MASAAAAVAFVGADELSVELYASFLRSGARVRCFVPEVRPRSPNRRPPALPPPAHVASFLRDDQAWLIGDSGAGGPVGIGGARGAERPPPVREPGGSRAR